MAKRPRKLVVKSPPVAPGPVLPPSRPTPAPTFADAPHDGKIYGRKNGQWIMLDRRLNRAPVVMAPVTPPPDA